MVLCSLLQCEEMGYFLLREECWEDVSVRSCEASLFQTNSKWKYLYLDKVRMQLQLHKLIWEDAPGH